MGEVSVPVLDVQKRAPRKKNRQVIIRKHSADRYLMLSFILAPGFNNGMIILGKRSWNCSAGRKGTASSSRWQLVRSRQQGNRGRVCRGRGLSSG